MQTIGVKRFNNADGLRFHLRLEEYLPGLHLTPFESIAVIFEGLPWSGSGNILQTGISLYFMNDISSSLEKKFHVECHNVPYLGLVCFLFILTILTHPLILFSLILSVDFTHPDNVVLLRTVNSDLKESP